MNERPLSPHLQIYRLPLTALASIFHRITGVLLSVGLIFLAGLLMAAAQGAEHYAPLRDFLGSLPGRALLWGWLYALCFHLCHGLRHLIWDSGRGFDRATLGRHAWYEVAASLILTVLLALARFV
ncbi:succinate dehydrogenase, cytochrome b556 subunit [Methylococcus sp. EFPC2]|uniref:succinate dehydrogenase, cytochrome b556 subunit n=1 Tax=Methylococcus sp. EFPC2 TaxID=2812648 RepID=UPI001966DE6C|nr:succinate dehydrogenase, cytochrome b556 subunit [Methylococcus sp. EFPC2]QSA95569.1 succinate dehydrogenase, cytochrome b556 subunit [Methylococcus sp. EFPC2]